MRIVIDFQGAQSSGSRNRGIGRYTQAFAHAMLRNSVDHEVIIALNGLFPETIEPIRADFAGLLPAENIRVWHAVGPVCGRDESNKSRRQIAELTREAFFESLKPDVVLITSLLEGLEDDAITSIGQFSNNLLTAVVLYDLIPLIHSKTYLNNPVVEHWYLNKIDQLRRANLLLSISASSGQEAIDYLGFPQESVVNISTACDSQFKRIKLNDSTKALLNKKYGLSRPFVMYTGGNDIRKNVEGLISAYAALPKRIRTGHQLAIVCSAHTALKEKWHQVAHDVGLSSGELIVTGFVPDEDLVAIYNACKLFVFPSWHEGFGLPALEAMSCGRAVIGANTSSIPEVIGYEDALFDPFDTASITNKIQAVLEDDNFRNELEQNAIIQSECFSWDKSACQAWRALEDIVFKNKSINSNSVVIGARRPRLAYFSPLPPEQSGISDYSAELLPELSRYYDIVVIVAQEEVIDSSVHATALVRDIAWFRQQAHSFDRIMYHFGNSEFHSHMFGLLKEFPGVVVLHDFFLSGIVAYLDGSGEKPHYWARSLINSHGWSALQLRYKNQDPSEVVYTYPCNLEVLQQALGIIVHSEASCRLADSWFGKGTSSNWSTIPLLRTPAVRVDKSISRQKFGIGENDFVVCSFGHLGRTKLNKRLFDTWLASPMSQHSQCHLIFVGQNNCGEYGVELAQLISNSKTSGRIEITGWTNIQDYKAWLSAADVGVQLRTLSRGETSAAVLDCMNYGLATIVNANGSMADLPSDSVMMLPDEFSDTQLTDALTKLWQNVDSRTRLGLQARNVVRTFHQPRRCAELYSKILERYYQQASVGLPTLVKTLADAVQSLSIEDTRQVSTSIANNFPPYPRRRQLLLDISELVLRDSKTGIQRVVRSFLMDLLLNPPEGYSVEPVYASADSPGYKYARRFTSRFLDVWDGWTEDLPVDVWAGDIFLGLEWQPAVAVPAQKNQLLGWQQSGIKVLFVVYDLLPVLMPQVFPPASYEMHQRWLETISCFDGAICISRSVADELYEWLKIFGAKRERHFELSWVHLGADVESSVPTIGIPAGADQLIEILKSRQSFLMVGTVEPRKGYLQTLAAFTKLWNEGWDINLVIVGQEGWKSLPENIRRTIPETIREIKTHPEFERKLFWLQGISDEYLEKLYEVSSCLIAASEGEGFGLPLIEAAQHNLPIIAREIPVFREVAGSNAFYFSGATNIASRLIEWLALKADGKHPESNSMPWLTWKQSTQSLLDVVINGEYYKKWVSDEIYRFCGSDIRLGVQVGMRNGLEVFTTGSSGYLLFGPYLSLAANQYQIKIKGWVGSGGLSGARMDVAIDKGTIILAESILSEPDLNGCMAIVPISLDQSCTDLEVRVWVSDQSDLNVSMIEIAPWQDEPVISQEVLKDAEQKVAQVSASTLSLIKNTSRLASTSSSRNQAKSKCKKRR